jgi:hypothetical protein
MKLTSENVEKVILESLFVSGEDVSTAVIGEGCRYKIGFHPERLKANETNIYEMLLCLPDEFMKSKGGGWSMLNACIDRNRVQWADLHDTVDRLITLGSAVGKVSFMLPREMWTALPGGMPYFVVND